MEQYQTAADDMESVMLRVYRNDSLQPFVKTSYDVDAKDFNSREAFEEAYDIAFNVDDDVKFIGELKLPLPPNTPAGEKIEVYIRGDANGIYVRAEIMRTGKKIDAQIMYENAMSNEELETTKKYFNEIRTTGSV